MSIPAHCAHTRMVDPNTLKSNPTNPNRHSTHQIQFLASIIHEQRWHNPVTISKHSGRIVSGQPRLREPAGSQKKTWVGQPDFWPTALEGTGLQIADNG